MRRRRRLLKFCNLGEKMPPKTYKMIADICLNCPLEKCKDTTHCKRFREEKRLLLEKINGKRRKKSNKKSVL